MNHEPTGVKAAIRQRVYALLESTDPTPVAKAVRLFIGLVILANVIAVIVESDESVYRVYGTALEIFNVVSVLGFTVEYALRLWASAENPRFAGASPWRARWAYFKSGMGLIDLAAIAPFYLGFLIPWDLRQLRALRLLRLLKLMRSFSGLDIFYSVLRSQVPNLVGTTLVIVILLVFSSSLMYAIEGSADVESIGIATQSVMPAELEAAPNEFTSIGRAMWWSVVTVTSVGYGDVVPRTRLGRLVGSIIMLLGVGLVAMPAAILAGKFSDELGVRRDRVTKQAFDYFRDGELDKAELDQLEERGKQEGLSVDEIEEIKESARGTVDGSRICPRCGYSA
jgi:voltage-gated potassium channel